jgi:hypothetical protein
MMNRKEGVMLLTRNTEIDTRAPFRSVKEAVTLFGDKVLAGELYATATKLKHPSSQEEVNQVRNRKLATSTKN